MFGYRRTPKPLPEPVCLQVSRRDAISFHQLFEGVLAMGGTGSGKSTTMAHLMAAIMRRGTGMLFLTAKITDMEAIRKIATAAGRLDDLIEFAPGRGRFDPITYELNCRGGSIQAASQFLTDLVDFVTKTNSQQSQEPIWSQTAARQLRAAATVIHHATGQWGAIAVTHEFTQRLQRLSACEAGNSSPGVGTARAGTPRTLAPTLGFSPAPAGPQSPDRPRAPTSSPSASAAA